MHDPKNTLSKEELLVDLTLVELREKTIFTPTCLDLSDRFKKGTVATTIPRRGGLEVEDRPNDGSEVAGSGLTYENDKLLIDNKKTVADFIYDEDEENSQVELKQDFYEDAGPALAEKIEADNVAKLIARGKTKSDGSTPNPNRFRLSGVGNKLITLDQLGALNQKMTEAKISKNDRFFLVSPRQARAIRGWDAIRNASAYGNADAIQNGFVGKVEGFIILECNNLTAFEVVAYQGKAIAWALAKQFKIDEERQATKKRDFVSVDANYGNQSVRDGILIFYGNDEDGFPTLTDGPEALNIYISGVLKVGEELTGNYTYFEKSNVSQGTSTFKWYRSDNAQGVNKSLISGAESVTHTVVAEDQDKYISFEVTPVDTDASSGTAVETALYGPVIA